MLRLVWEVLDTPEVYEALARQGGTTEDVQLRERLRDLKLQRDRVLALYARGDLSEDRWRRQDRDLGEQEGPLERGLADLTRARRWRRAEPRHGPTPLGGKRRARAARVLVGADPVRQGEPASDGRGLDPDPLHQAW